jgi:hypothetical protein
MMMHRAWLLAFGLAMLELVGVSLVSTLFLIVEIALCRSTERIWLDADMCHVVGGAG